jgi:hypothetical protein
MNIEGRRRRPRPDSGAKLGKARPGDTPSYTKAEAKAVIAGGKTRATKRRRRRTTTKR